MTHTRLWLCTGIVGEHYDEDEEDQDGLVRIQRVLVMPLTAGRDEALAMFSSFIEATYRGGKAERAVPISSLEELAEGLLTLDGLVQLQLDGVPADTMPTALNIEVAYDDFSPLSQQTPSRLESILFPCRTLAVEAQDAVDKVSSTLELGRLVTCWPDTSHSDRSDSPESAVGLMTCMLEEMYGDDEE